MTLVISACAASKPSDPVTSAQGNDPRYTGSVEQSISDAPLGVPDGGISDNSALLDALWKDRRERPTNLGIGPGDVLEITATGVEEIQKQQVRVDEDGYINVPLVGRLQVAGLSEDELNASLRESLKKYVYNPDVHVFVTSYLSRQVAVTGAVHNPGLVTISSATNTVREILQRAGGPTEMAARRVLLTPGDSPTADGVRQAAFDPRNGQNPAKLDGGSRQELLVIDMDQKNNDRYLDLPVRPGDALYVPPGGNVTIVGWVYTPKTVQVTPGLTVLQAIASAGGPLFAADKTNVKLIRQNAVGAPEVYSLDLSKIENLQQRDIPVRDGDVVQVPYSIARIPGYGVYYAVQALVSFSPYLLLSGAI